MELSEFRVTPGNQDPHQRGEIKKPSFGFPYGNQSEREPNERFSRKLEYNQGILVPSDGRICGLEMIWREGVDVRFKSCSNSHIDVVVHGEGRSNPWRVTSFYGHLMQARGIFLGSFLCL